MMKKYFRLYRPGGRHVSGYRFGKLVQRRYIDLVATDTASPDLETFLEMLREVHGETDDETFGQCRVGYVDDKGVGLYYDPLEFLENEGSMPEYTLPEALA